MDDDIVLKSHERTLANHELLLKMLAKNVREIDEQVEKLSRER